MTCRTVQDLLSSYFDEELDARTSTQVSAHLECCRACSEELHVLRLLRRSLLRVPASSCPEGMWQALNERISKAPPVVPTRQTTSSSWVLAAAGLTLITLLRPSWLPLPESQEVDRAALLEVSEPAPHAHPRPSKRPGLRLAVLRPSYLSKISSPYERPVALPARPPNPVSRPPARTLATVTELPHFYVSGQAGNARNHQTPARGIIGSKLALSRSAGFHVVRRETGAVRSAPSPALNPEHTDLMQAAETSAHDDAAVQDSGRDMWGIALTSGATVSNSTAEL